MANVNESASYLFIGKSIRFWEITVVEPYFFLHSLFFYFILLLGLLLYCTLLIIIIIIPRPILRFFNRNVRRNPLVREGKCFVPRRSDLFAVRLQLHRHTRAYDVKNQGRKQSLTWKIMSSKSDEQANSNKVVNVEEAKEYMKEHVDPIISELLTDIVVDRPENVLKYMLEWTRKKRENDPEMIKLREQAANAYRLNNDRPVTPPAKKGGSSYSGQPRNLSYVGTLGGGNTLSGSGKEQDENEME